MFSQPEEKLWLVVKNYNGVLESNPSQTFGEKRGIKLEKNSIIKMGRVRLRVRDIDYPEDETKNRAMLQKQLASSTDKSQSSPEKKANSATKLKKEDKSE